MTCTAYGVQTQNWDERFPSFRALEYKSYKIILKTCGSQYSDASNFQIFPISDFVGANWDASKSPSDLSAPSHTIHRNEGWDEDPRSATSKLRNDHPLECSNHFQSSSQTSKAVVDFALKQYSVISYRNVQDVPGDILGGSSQSQIMFIMISMISITPLSIYLSI